MGGNRLSNASSDAEFITSYVEQMRAYDSLPPIVRRALSLAWGNYSAEAEHFRLFRYCVPPHQIVADLQRTDLRKANGALNYTPYNLYSLQEKRPCRRKRRSARSSRSC